MIKRICDACNCDTGNDRQMALAKIHTGKVGKFECTIRIVIHPPQGTEEAQIDLCNNCLEEAAAQVYREQFEIHLLKVEL